METVLEVAKDLKAKLEARGFQSQKVVELGDGAAYQLSSTSLGIEVLVDNYDYLIVSLASAGSWEIMPGLTQWAQCLGIEAPEEPVGWQRWTRAEKLERSKETAALCQHVLDLIDRENRQGFRELANCAEARLNEYNRLRNG